MKTIGSIIFLVSMLIVPAYANQPYIDAVREKLPAQKDPAEGYIDQLKKELGTESTQGQPYVDALRKNDPKTFQPDEESKSYILEEKEKLPALEEKSAILAVKEGKSDLKLKKTGRISGMAGVRVGTQVDRGIEAGEFQAQAFSTVYTKAWNPDVTLFYEYQPFHSEWFGNFGLLASLSYSQYFGTGVFAADVTNGAFSFGTTSRTKFTFFQLSPSIGVTYRFNLLRVVRPFVHAGAQLNGYMETRSDGRGSTKRGYSTGFLLSGGVNLSLDWISDAASWDMYADYGIHHMYITVEYVKQTPLAGAVSFDISGIYAGLAFEF